jgi:hypothetical protein
MSPPFDGELAAGVLGNTLMLTGASCLGYSGCHGSFVAQRYSVANLSPIGAQIPLSQNLENQFNTPAMGPVLGQMAILWNEAESPGQVFRTMIKADGTFAQPVSATASNIVTKALVESASGGALLIGTIASGTPTMYQLVAQRLDSTLSLVGAPLPLADPVSSDATGLELHPSSDGSQVLLTYRPAGARYRLLATSLCGN